MSLFIFFTGVGVARSDGIEGVFAYIRTEEYTCSPLHVMDVKNAFDEVSEKGMNDPNQIYADWKFKGTYDFIIEVGDVFFGHMTNITEEAYQEYKGDDLILQNVIRKQLADWYFEQSFVYYYLWKDGEYKYRYMEDGVETDQAWVVSKLTPQDESVDIGIGFSEELLEQGQERWNVVRQHLLIGSAFMVAGVLLFAFCLLVLVPGTFQNMDRRSYSDLLAVCATLALWFCYVNSRGILQADYLGVSQTVMLQSILPRAIILSVPALVFVFCVVCIAINILSHKGERNEFFFYHVFVYMRRRVTGEAYYKLGMVECEQKRFRFAVGLSVISVGVVFVVIQVISGFWYSVDMSKHAEMQVSLAVGSAIVLVSGCLTSMILYGYRQGTRNIHREYGRLLNQLSQIYNGEYQSHDMLEEGSVFAGESRKMSMLGCQIQDNIQKQIQAEKMKIDLITNVSHDLKTPLTSIISYIDLLSKEELSPVALDYVKVLENKSGHLRKMIADVFDLAKASSGEMEVKHDTVNLNRLLIQTMADMEREIEDAPVKVVTEISEETGILSSDGQKIYRVLQNVIENALKYSMKGTRIYVTLWVENREAVVRVKNVAGYEMNFSKEDVLGRFFRGDEARSTEGSGLGLAIAKEFMEICGGELDVVIDGDVFIVEMRFSCRDVIVPARKPQ